MYLSLGPLLIYWSLDPKKKKHILVKLENFDSKSARKLFQLYQKRQSSHARDISESRLEEDNEKAERYPIMNSSNNIYQYATFCMISSHIYLTLFCYCDIKEQDFSNQHTSFKFTCTSICEPKIVNEICINHACIVAAPSSTQPIMTPLKPKLWPSFKAWKPCAKKKGSFRIFSLHNS